MKSIALLAALVIYPDLDDPWRVSLHSIYDGESSVEDCWHELDRLDLSGYCVAQELSPRPPSPPSRPETLCAAVCARPLED